ncbi:MAG: GerMN domain-containing protein [Acidobacteria bacterium]|nr:GerMN domain-containing protein [Acidobacteriota bacterium]
MARNPMRGALRKRIRESLLSTRRGFSWKSRRAIWIAAAVVAGVIVISLLFWRGSPQQGGANGGAGQGSIERQELAGANLAKIGVSVYFRQAGSRSLAPSSRDIFAARSPEVRARQLIQALVEGPQPAEANQVVAVLPKEAKVRQIYLLKDGTAVVDFSEEVSSLLPGGIDSEATAMESIRRTLLENVKEIKAVRFLINGKDTETFAGHIAIG